jgi:hypothetical protein
MNWIPCNKELPKTPGLYLVTTISYNVYIYFFHPGSKFFERGFYLDTEDLGLGVKVPDKQVIAWAHRPVPYREN